jgi:diguanylate cyclase (GGDEF)-like protein/PAS domain S-box-containing protein
MPPESGSHRSARLAARLRLARARLRVVGARLRGPLGDTLRDPGGRILLLAGTCVLGYLAWLATPGVPRGQREAWGGFALLPSAILAVGFAWRTSRCAAVDARSRRAWRQLAAAFALYFVSEVVWVALGQPQASAADIGFVAFYGFAFLGLLGFPTGEETPGRRLQFWLDAGTVMLAGLLMVWYLILGPFATMGGGTWRSSLAILSYPVGDLLLLFGATALLLRGSAGESRRALVIVGLGTLAYLVADLAYAALALADRYHAGLPNDAGWVLGQMAVALGAHVHHRAAAASGALPPRAAPPVRRGRAFYVLPYAAVAVVYGLLLVVAEREWTVPTAGLLLGAVALTALVSARQVKAMLENTRLETLAAARRGEARFAALVQQASDVIAVLDAHTRILYTSPSMERVFGWAPSAVVGTHLLDAVHEEDRELVLGEFRRVSERPGATSLLCVRVRRPDGAWRHAESSLTNLAHDPAVGGIVLNGRDVTERKNLEAALAHQAFHDALTHLPNRALFHDRVVHALARAQREGGGVAVLYLDLDDFKAVNDSLGHAAGDRLLFEVAGRLLNATRGSDTVARLGGDEFAVLLENIRHGDDERVVAERVLTALRRPLILDGTAVVPTGSLGIARARPDDDAEMLLRNADTAMYLAKERGKGACECFAPGMHDAMHERLGIENDLRLAVERGEFHLEYQPIVSLDGGRITAFEALARWAHPSRGTVPPALFIPHAERTGLIVPLGRWVLREACRQLAEWRRELGPAGHTLGMSVNVSARQLQEGAGLVHDVRTALADAALPPECLTLEITESVMMQDTEAAHAVLSQLSALRVHLAVDDFGIGYSSLSYIERFPVDVLKIDKSFVDRIAAEASAGNGESPLTAAIILIGQTLGLHVVAEGIERAGQAHRLRELGCEFGQGYLFARPLPPREAACRLLHELAAERPTIAGAA